MLLKTPSRSVPVAQFEAIASSPTYISARSCTSRCSVGPHLLNTSESKAYLDLAEIATVNPPHL